LGHVWAEGDITIARKLDALVNSITNSHLSGSGSASTAQGPTGLAGAFPGVHADVLVPITPAAPSGPLPLVRGMTNGGQPDGQTRMKATSMLVRPPGSLDR
jgi:hypothetical protein